MCLAQKRPPLLYVYVHDFEGHFHNIPPRINIGYARIQGSPKGSAMPLSETKSAPFPGQVLYSTSQLGVFTLRPPLFSVACHWEIGSGLEMERHRDKVATQSTSQISGQHLGQKWGQFAVPFFGEHSKISLFIT